MDRLRRRQDFVAAARALSIALPGMVVQARLRPDQNAPRVGFTCTRKLGNAVARNRIKRRLREAVRLTMPELARNGFDYVVIGRAATMTRPFIKLTGDVATALGRLHGAPDKEQP
jgi:ribonuclease P protein component